MKNNEFQKLVDQNLSGLVWDERKRQKVLHALNEEEKPVKKFSTTFILIAAIVCLSVTALAAGLIFSPKYDAIRVADLDFNADLIINAASPASPDLFVRAPVETMLANIFGTKNLLDYARRIAGCKVVFVSSSEVYGKATPRKEGFLESDCGDVDLLNVRSSYPMGKRSAETLCVCYEKEYGVNVSIVRPGHVYGPTASPSDRRVSSAFAWQAARGESIVLKSAGLSRRSYTHCEDCASAIMTVAEHGAPGEAYNIANRDGVCSIRQMAEIMADEGGVDLRIENASVADAAEFNPMDNSCLDPSKLESLGWRGEIGYEAGFRMTVRAIREMFLSAKGVVHGA